MTRIEHINITVPDIEAAVTFLKIAAPDFKIRKDVRPDNSHRWLHIGNENYYFALQEPHVNSTPKKPHSAYINYGINHIALVVPSIQKVKDDLDAAGYQRSINTPTEKFRRRIYFFDHAGFEWEFIEYLSEKPDDKFLYE